MNTVTGWDLPNVSFQKGVIPGQINPEETRVSIQKKFSHFIRNFRVFDIAPYRTQLIENIKEGKYFLEVELEHLETYDPELVEAIKNKPADLLPLFEDAARDFAIWVLKPEDEKKVPKVQVMLLSHATPTPIRDLDAGYISKLVTIPGITISVSQLAAKAVNVHIMCKSCRHTQVLSVTSGLSGIQLPRVCDSAPDATGTKDCPVDPFVIVHEKSDFVDQQTLKLQETSDMIPVGELPRHMLLTADRYLTNKVIPGTRVTVTGILSLFQTKQTGKAVAIRHSYIRVIGLKVDLDGSSRSGRSFSEEDEEEFTRMARTPNFFELFSHSVAPQIYGHSDIKKAVACLLFGGSKKILPDGLRLRGDINVLLLGDPGTAKSQLLKFVEKVAPIAVYTSGKGSSAAGLTASVVRDPTTREFYLEGGAMVLADGGVVCIDEFDKMRDEDRVAIHEAMEQQTISIAKAGITTILNSRASVLAAANPIFGRYNDMKSPGENIEFQSTILSRFDLIFIVRDEHNEQRDKTIAKHVLNLHMSHLSDASTVGDIDIQKMRSFIGFCRSKCAPRLSQEASQKLISHFVEVRGKVRSMAKNENVRTAIPITVRQLEAIVRITESLAKMTLAPVATEAHVDEAIRLFNISTLHAIQATPVDGYTRPQFMNEVEQIQQQIRKRLPSGAQISTASLTKDLMGHGFNEISIDRAIHILVQKEVLRYIDRRLIIKRISF